MREIYKINAIACDGFGCGQLYEAGAPGVTWPVVKREARAEGWHAPRSDNYGEGPHYCPSHKADGAA